MARLLSDMYDDEMNWLLLIFLDPILKEISSLNKSFQSTRADLTKLYADLRRFLVATSRRFLKTSFLRPVENENGVLLETDVDCIKKALERIDADFGNSCLPLDSIDFGFQFEKEIKKTKISKEKVTCVLQRARSFLIKLVNELCKRLPNNIDIIAKMQYLRPDKCLSAFSLRTLQHWPWSLAGKFLLNPNKFLLYINIILIQYNN